jgi:transposase
MLQITPQMKILLAVEPADFRRGIDGPARLCQEVLRHDPFGGTVFVFRDRKATTLKLLVYDGQGFWLCHKRQASDDMPGRTHQPPAGHPPPRRTEAGVAPP